MSDIVDELRLIGCHENGEARCTCGIGMDAADEITRLRAENAALTRERDALRDALERCPPDRPQSSHAEFREAVNTWWKLWARPALKGATETTSYGSSKWGPHFPPSSCTAWEDCVSDGDCHDPNCGAPSQHCGEDHPHD